jgi:hypothetical protein
LRVRGNLGQVEGGAVNPNFVEGEIAVKIEWKREKENEDEIWRNENEKLKN